MAKNVSNNQTLEEFRQSYNSLVDEVGGLGSLRTSQKGSLVDSINSIIDQYFFFQDFEFDGSDGSSSNRTFSGTDNFGNTLKYSVTRLLVYKNGLLLRSGTDYSATNGTSITLQSSAANSDIIRITSFTGSYEGVAGATQGAVTQWTKTGAGSIYNHDTTGGVVINSDATGIVTAPTSGVGIQLESDGSDIFLNAGGSSNKVDVNANLSLRSGMKLQKAGGDIAIGDIQGLQAAVRGALSASGDISYNNSTGVISFSQAGAPVTSVFGRTGAVTLTTADVTGVVNTSNLTENTNLFYTDERVDDRVGSLLQAGTNMSLSYDDAAGTLTISSSGKTQEEIEDIVGAMFSSNTESGLSVTYDDSDGTLDVDVDDFSITLTGDVTGAGTVTNLGNVSFATTIAANSVALGTDTTGAYVSDVNVDSGELTASESNNAGETNSVTLGLANSGVSAGTYGSASAIPALTIDAFGRVTSASTNAVDTYSGWSQAADSGTTKSVVEGTTMTLAGGEGIDTSISGSTVTVAGENATATNKGIASFNSNHFSVSSGAVSILAEFIEDTVGAMVTSNSESGITVTYDDTDGTLDFSTSVTQTPAITSNGSTPSLNSGISATEIRNVIGLGTAATINFDGAYSSLSGLPTIPSNNNQLTNGAGYLTGITSSQVTSALGFTPYSNSNPSGFTTNTGTTTASNTQTFTNKSGNISQWTNNSGYTTYTSNQATNNNSTVQFAEVRSTGDVIAYYSSDFALKENINPISNALDKVSQLGGYNFDWKDTHLENRGGLDDMFVKKSDVGIIAQEVQKVLPEAVGKREDGTLGVRYELLVPLLVESIKELSEKVKELGGE